ncbi:TniQ family protein [Marinomonas sp. S3726]|uniref:TniQ family protein n=1 Tax=Marinomonas sp. S3726 TaxID=579484 RepID=UPI0006973D67|nr:TniQ family protein [Marinomonas sp. S3726]
MLLPLHPKPFKDELLSSWATRLAIENGMYSHALYKGVLNLDSSIFTRDIDRLYIPELINKLEVKTKQNAEQIKNLMLTSFEGQLFEKINSNGFTKWILPLGIYHRTRKKHGIQYCPQCLKDSSTAYFRKHWRLSFCLFCEKHQCLLRDKCPHCNNVIDYQRRGIGSQQYETPATDLSLCSFCERPLWQGNNRKISSELEPYIGLCLHFTKQFTKGEPCFPSLNQPLALQEFNGLWELIAGLMKRRYFEGGIKTKIKEILNIDIASSIDQKSHPSFELRSSEERLKILITVLWLLDDWPNRLITLSEGTIFSKSAYSDFDRPLCYWLRQVIFSDLDKSIYTANIEELNSIVKYLKKHRIPTTDRTVSLYANMYVGTLRKKVGFVANLSNPTFPKKT